MAGIIEPGTRRAAVVVGAAAVLVLAVLTVQQQRRWESSITLFEHALRVTTDNTLAHKNLGSAYRARGDAALAKHHTRLGAMLQVRELLELRPSTADAHQRLGLAYLDLELYEEAAAAFREALLLRPAMAAAHNGLGVALARLGRRNEAIEEFRRAAEAEPDNPAARANLRAIQDSAGVAPDATP